MKTSAPGETLEALKRAGVGSIVPINDWELLGKPELFPKAAGLSRRTVSLPIYPGLADEELDRIIAAVKECPR